MTKERKTELAKIFDTEISIGDTICEICRARSSQTKRNSIDAAMLIDETPSTFTPRSNECNNVIDFFNLTFTCRFFLGTFIRVQ